MSNLSLVKELRELTLAGMGDCRAALEESGWDMPKAIDLIKARGLNIAAKNEGKVAAEGVVVTLDTSNGLASMVEVNCQTDFVAKSKDFMDFAGNVNQQILLSVIKNKPFKVESVDGDRKSLAATTKENIVVRRWWVEQASHPLAKVFVYTHSNNKIGVILTLLAPSESAWHTDEFDALGNDLTLQIAAMSPSAVDKDHLDPAEVARQKAIFEVQLTEAKKPQASWEKILAGKFNKWHSEVCLLEQESIIVPKTSVGQLVKNAGVKLGGEITVVGFTRCQVGEGIEVEKIDFAAEVNQLAGV
jgi:elongation factor Ts